MKKILIIAIVLITSITAFAERTYYRATHFSYKEGRNWSKWETTNIGILYDDVDYNIFIDSKTPQIYHLIEFINEGYDEDGDYVKEYRFIDQDSDYGIIKFVSRNALKRNEIYIIFNNVSWLYVVELI